MGSMSSVDECFYEDDEYEEEDPSSSDSRVARSTTHTLFPRVAASMINLNYFSLKKCNVRIFGFKRHARSGEFCRQEEIHSPVFKLRVH